MENQTKLESWLKKNNLNEPNVLTQLIESRLSLSTILTASDEDMRELCKNLSFSAPIRIKLMAGRRISLQESNKAQEAQGQRQEEEAKAEAEAEAEENGDDDDDDNDDDEHSEEEKLHVEENTASGIESENENENIEKVARFEEDAEFAICLQMDEIHTNKSKLNQDNSVRDHEDDEAFARALADKEEENKERFEDSHQQQQQQQMIMESPIEFIDQDTTENVNDEWTVIQSQEQQEISPHHAFGQIRSSIRCPICDQSFSDDDVAITLRHCQCQTHKDCVDEWVKIFSAYKQTPNCPLHIQVSID